MEDRNTIFQLLKPPCVALSQAALALNGPQRNGEVVTTRLEALKHALSSVVQPPSTLDSKLADYAFFPLSQVLKASQSVSVRALELCLQCLDVLIDQGWRDKIAPPLAAQIIILCTLLAEKHPKGLSFEQSTDELRSGAFSCLHHLFSTISIASAVQQTLVAEANFPQLGQSISVILDGIYDGGSFEVQVSACQALRYLLLNILDEESQANFLPGIVSKLTRVLTPQTRLRRNPKVLTQCLDIVGALFRHTVNDGHYSTTREAGRNKASLNEQAKMKSVIDRQWLEQAAVQIKPAVRNIVKLRLHSRQDVQDALGRLCSVLLQDCWKTLENCSYMALETMVTMSAAKPNQATASNLRMLVATDTNISGLLQTILYDWLRSLITTMQGPDEQKKMSQIQQISTSYELLRSGRIDTTTLDRMLAGTLRDSIVSTLNLPGSIDKTEPLASPMQTVELDVSNVGSAIRQYQSPLIRFRGQEDTMQAVEQFIRMVASSSSTLDFPNDLARSLLQSSGESLVANFWLLLTATQDALQRQDSTSDLLDVEDDSPAIYQEHLEELYSYSLSILSDSSDEEVDPRLQALSLRSIALRAQTAGYEFRYELGDALYPVLHVLATPDESLQRDSITTLNILTSACGYSSVKDLIVDNVDYLTNAVALKLNAFDVSPQAPQVLLMMVRLAGPRLLPYLEDTIESIFSALDDYHGYPLLVELLFRVLGVIAEEGAKTPQLAIAEDDGRQTYHTVLQERWQPTTLAGLAALLRINAEEQIDGEALDSPIIESYPREPWNGIAKVESEDGNVDETDDPAANQLDESDPPPPAPKTYNLLLKITEMTQHFLTSASSSLRSSLLSLIRTTVPALARHDNSFLPLVNTLWPEVTSRLDDNEPHVVATALDIVSVLCDYAGTFMRSRMTQLWPRLVEIHEGLVKDIVQANLHLPAPPTQSNRRELSQSAGNAQIKEAVSRMQAAPANYGDTSSRMVWNSLVACITSAVKTVQVPPEIFDEALTMVQPVLWREELASVFVKENSDAVWLARLRAGVIAEPYMPPVMNDLPWRFAQVHA